MTKARDREEGWKSCPLPRLTLGRRTTPAAGAHRAPSRVTMRLGKLDIITRPMERAAEDDGRRRLTCPP
jgi:hypothetical protein